MKTKFIIMSIASLLLLAMNSFGQSTHNININSSSFSDADITINVGDKVIWTNNSGLTHTVTEGTSCTNNGFDSGNIAGNGGTFERTFSTAGIVNYFCKPHCGAGMVGKITVVNTTEVIINSKLITQIKTFPNPFVSTSEIQVQLAHAGKVTVEIYDMYGHRLMELPEGERTDGLHKFAISGESLRDGIFICKVYVNGKPAASEYLVKKSKSE